MRPTKSYIEAIASAKQQIDDHPGKHYTAGELAKLLGVNSSQLKKIFKREYGIGIYAYQLKQRLQQAGLLISEEDATLKSIARQTGFKQLSNFTTAFKKEFGMTPGQFRNTRY